MCPVHPPASEEGLGRGINTLGTLCLVTQPGFIEEAPEPTEDEMRFIPLGWLPKFLSF